MRGVSCSRCRLFLLTFILSRCLLSHAFTTLPPPTTTTLATRFHYPAARLYSTTPANAFDNPRTTTTNSKNNNQVSSSNTILDPLVARLLLSRDDADSSLEGNTSNDDSILFEFRSLRMASQGLAVWRVSLLQGRLPTELDFDLDFDANGGTGVWPPEPLYAPLQKAMAELQFPRFVLRHPEIISTVLVSLLRMTTKFQQEWSQKLLLDANGVDEEDDDEEEEWDRWSYGADDNYEEEDEEVEDDLGVEDFAVDDATVSDQEIAQLAMDIVAEGLTKQWGGAMTGVQALDQLFGVDHGLLELPPNGIPANNNDDDGDTENMGFGLEDGIWQHSGWKLLPALQREMAAMPELNELMQALGRRPTAEDSDATHKFVPRRLDDEGALGAQYDPTQRVSVQGITLSGSLSDMLPSEAMLLVQQRQKKETAPDDGTEEEPPTDEQPGKTRLSSPFRRLFLAKMVESKLLSYEASGWQDVPSSNVPNPRYLSRLPSAPGGPVIICLDTSWSMTGRREQLSKAVVLACVGAAHRQKRDIQVVAFSSAQNVMEAGPIPANTAGVRRLLEFLSSSFGGGTDVTGALSHAMRTVAGSNNGAAIDDGNTAVHGNVSKRRQPIIRSDLHNHMAAADILLVTDGEIPDPPVSKDIMESLDRLKRREGVQVHGLLVGKRESLPLSRLCTEMHDFLTGYESTFPTTAGAISPGMGRGLRYPSRSTALQAMPQTKFSRWDRKYSSRRPSLLRAKYSDYDNDYDYFDSGEGRTRPSRGKKRRSRDTYNNNDDYIDMEDPEVPNLPSTSRTETQAASSGSFSSEIDEAVHLLKTSVAQSIQSEQWQVSSLDDEMNSENRHRGKLDKAIKRISEGLVEREEEARLVVLGMVAQEHVLFLGPPGTAKSVLGRRLSQLCGGVFFQRLFTRFTTPEEIFGPLSLRALENDEYRRKTDGFLPTATVAFLDEIFKANSAILNTLLTILNERQFDNGAGVREECPIRCVVGASNELPESDELDALYDRFLLRKEVLPVSDEGVMRLLGMPLPGLSPCDSSEVQESDNACDTVFTDDLDKVIAGLSIAADSVAMDEEACTLMRELRSFMRQEMDVDVSDRRLVKATRLLKVSAASHGRTKVDPIDCLLLQHIIWRTPEQRSALREWLWNNVTPGSSSSAPLTIQDESLESAASSSVRQFRLLLDGLQSEAIAAVRKTSGDVTGENGAKKADVDLILSLSEEARRLGGALSRRIGELSRHAELLVRSSDHLWLDPNEAQAAKQLLLPRANAYLEATDRTLHDARFLHMALSCEGSLTDENRITAIELLWGKDSDQTFAFTMEALAMSMKEAKAKYDVETFRKWKRARKKSES